MSWSPEAKLHQLHPTTPTAPWNLLWVSFLFQNVEDKKEREVKSSSILFPKWRAVTYASSIEGDFGSKCSTDSGVRDLGLNSRLMIKWKRRWWEALLWSSDLLPKKSVTTCPKEWLTRSWKQKLNTNHLERNMLQIFQKSLLVGVNRPTFALGFLLW